MYITLKGLIKLLLVKCKIPLFNLHGSFLIHIFQRKYCIFTNMYLVPRYNPIRRLQWFRRRWIWMKVKLKLYKKCNKKIYISGILFNTQASYTLPRYIPIRHFQWPSLWWTWPTIKDFDFIFEAILPSI